MIEDPHATLRIDTRLLQAVALGFAALGLAVALAGDGAAFAMWRTAAARALFDAHALPERVVAFASITDGILGGTIAGKWIAAWWIIRVPLARGEAWAKHALVWGLATWFVIDSAVSLAAGAVFNLWMINCVPVIVFGGFLVRTRAQVSTTASPTTGPWRVVELACWVSAALGLVIAVAIDTPVFAPWRSAAAAALGDDTGELAPPLRTWLAFVAGPIGGSTVGHFVMLALAVRHAAGQRWVWQAIAASVATWFVIDSALSLAHGAAFNVLLVNLPALALVAAPLAWARP